MSLQETFFKKLLISLLSTAFELAFGEAEISIDKFLNDTLSKNILQIEYSKFVLLKAGDQDIKLFAKEIISDCLDANINVTRIANNANIEIFDASELAIKARKIILEQYDESFNEMYLKNQIEMHE